MKKLGAVLFAVVAIETFYEHPTYGTGMRALLAAIQAGELFA